LLNGVREASLRDRGDGASPSRRPRAAGVDPRDILEAALSLSQRPQTVNGGALNAGRLGYRRDLPLVQARRIGV
jgi:hypothetical protein